MGDRSQPRPVLVAAALLLATFVAYLPALSAGYVWDDNDWLTENPAVTADDGWAAIWSGEARLQYYPMLFSAWRVQHALWGLNPSGYHAVNIALHALTSILLGLLLLRLDLRGAWWIALAFALHPINVESVAWITELKNVLSGAFVLGALLLFARGIGREESDRTGYALSLLLFACAVMTKTAVATAAFVLPLLCLRLKGRLSPRHLGLAAPFVAVGAVFAWITIRLEHGFAASAGADFSFTWIERLLIGSRALFFYPYKLVDTGPYVFNYPRWDLTGWTAWIWPPLVLVGAAACIVSWRKGYRGPVLALAVYVLMIAPALGLINVYAFRYSFVADHFAYLAVIGVLIFIVEAVVRLFPGTSRQGWVVGIALLAALGVLTWNQTRAYHDATTLWKHTIRHNPDSWLAHHSLALEYLETRQDLSEHHFERALASKPDSIESLTGRAMLWIRQGRVAEAVAELDRALVLSPQYPQARMQRGIALTRLQRWPDALADLDPFLAANPNTVEALAARAEARMRLGNHPGAIADLDVALAAGGPPGMIVDRGVVRVAAGDLDAAMTDARRAQEIVSVAARGWELEGVVWFQRGDTDTSCQALQRACELGMCRVYEGTCAGARP